MRCKICNTVFKPRYFLQKTCDNSECNSLKPIHKQQNKRKPIPKVSKKKKILDIQYSVLRIEFLGKKENKICPITKLPTTECHHLWSGKDRSKYYLDTSTWLAVSRIGHNWIHENPKEARDLGFLY